MSWVTAALEFFSTNGITLDYFDVSGTDFFSPEETYSWSEHQSDLLRIVGSGHIDSIGLYCNPDMRAPRSAWHATASMEMRTGLLFLGIDDSWHARHRELLEAALAMCSDHLGVGYGISFRRALAQGPDSYAAGVLEGSLQAIGGWLTGESDEGHRITAWLHEMLGARRYLSGLFRGAYVSSILSAAHIAALHRLRQSAEIPGTLTTLPQHRLWIWELAEPDLPAAELLLRDGGLLVA
jgi:hypothetical protein